jgi:hypothetical protein
VEEGDEMHVPFPVPLLIPGEDAELLEGSDILLVHTRTVGDLLDRE